MLRVANHRKVILLNLVLQGMSRNQEKEETMKDTGKKKITATQTA